MNFSKFLIDFKGKTDTFFNTEAQCYDSGKDSQLLLYSNIQKASFDELV